VGEDKAERQSEVTTNKPEEAQGEKEKTKKNVDQDRVGLSSLEEESKEAQRIPWENFMDESWLGGAVQV
jgi:hypothetical protein